MIFSENVVLVVGHRGFPRKHPDNTLKGFARAFEFVAMVETDVRRTGDGELVLSHDPVVDGRVVAASSWRELRQVDVGSGERMVSLDQAIAAFPGRRWNLEVKNFPGDFGYEPDLRIASETAQRATADDLCSSFYWPNMDLVRADFPAISTGLLLEEGTSLEDAIDHAASGGHICVIPQWTMIIERPDLVEVARRRGLAVATWTVNDPETAIRLADAGVAAIISDDPELILEAVS